MARLHFLAVACVLHGGGVRALEPSAASPDWFPFTISAFDDRAAALDLSILNEKPAGKNRATFTVSTSSLLDDIAANKGNIWSNWRRFYNPAGFDGTQALKQPTAISMPWTRRPKIAPSGRSLRRGKPFGG